MTDETANGRDTSRDGRDNEREFKLLTGWGPVWKMVQRIPPLERRANVQIVDRANTKMAYRPYPFSTMAPYTSWASLTDRTFCGRHLPPPITPIPDLPAPDQVADLFVRKENQFTPCPKSTVLFSYFAQWFTDGFLRSDRHDPEDQRKNNSNHEIDLMQIYGLTPAATAQLRDSHGGLLKSQQINGEEYPPFLYETGPDGNPVKKTEFSEIEPVPTKLKSEIPQDKQAGFFALGSDTGNLQLGFVMMNVLFFREHNRVARELADRHPEWDNDRIFETARNILIVLLIKVVVEDYINHITPYHFQFRADPSGFTNPPWYRPNWMAIEFNLVYRWHQLVPDTYRVGGEDLTVHQTLYETDKLTANGLGRLFKEASDQRAGKVGLFNTSPELTRVQVWSVEKGRAVDLAGYNDYREACSFPRVTAFNQISGDPKVQQALEDLYGTVDRVEFFPGLYAEDIRPNSVLPSLVGRMVGVDAFSQAFTNPLLAPRIFNRDTFSDFGMDLIERTRTLSDILNRNLPADSGKVPVSMTRKGWSRTRG